MRTWKGAKRPPSEGMLVTLPEAGSTRMVPSSSWAEATLTAKFCPDSGAVSVKMYHSLCVATLAKDIELDAVGRQFEP